MTFTYYKRRLELKSQCYGVIMPFELGAARLLPMPSMQSQQLFWQTIETPDLHNGVE